MSSLAGSGARGGMVTLFAQLVSLTTRLLGIVMLARLVSPAIFGLSALAISLTTIIATIVSLGLPMATAQVPSLSQATKSALFFVNLVLGLVLGGVTFALAGVVADAYGEPRLEQLMRWLAAAPILSGVQAQFRVQLIRDLRFMTLGIGDIASQFLATAAAIALAYSGRPYAALIALGVAQSLFQLIAVVASSRWLPGRPGNWATDVKGIVGIGLDIFGTTLLRDASRNALLPIVGLSQTPASVGSFDRAQQLSIVPISLTVDQMQRVAIPILSRLRSDPQRMQAYMRRAQLVSSYATATMFMTSAVVAQPLFLVLLGEEWGVAASVFQILAIGAAFRTLGQSMQWVFVAAGESRSALRLSVWSSPAIVLLSVSGLHWGVLGVAVTNSLAWSLYWPLATCMASRSAGFSPRPLLADATRAVLCFSAPVALAASLAQFAGLPAAQTLVASALLAVFAAGVSALVLPRVRADLKDILETVKMARRNN